MSSLSSSTRDAALATDHRALRIHAYGGPEVVQLDRVGKSEPAGDEVLVRVHAAGVNGLDWKIRDGVLQDVFRLPMPITLGIELAGEVIEVGADVSGFAVGDRVMGALGGLGTYRDEVCIAASKLAHAPAALDDVRAAAVPVASLTAWQALFTAGQLKRGETVLIHGAAGGVGGYAVQFAKRSGAQVVCTAKGVHADYLHELGADEVIDYQTQAFWQTAKRVDLVLDLVGGSVLDNSWPVLAPHGRIVSTAAPNVVADAPAGHRGIWFQMLPDGHRLAEIAAIVAAGELRTEVSEVVGLAEAAHAIERNKTGHGRGKTVIRLR